MKWTITGRGSDQKGFTLVELLAVMAIIGVLAAIVIPTVSGTRDAGQDAQAKQDISTIENAANEKFSNAQNLAQILSTETATTTAQINSVTATSTPQVISSRWAERFLTATTSATYLNEFPPAGGLTDGTVINVIVTDLDGIAITGSGLMSGYTAVDVDLLEREGYMTQVPSSVGKVVTVGSFDYHIYLWLFRKETSAGGGSADDARKAVLFKLKNAQIIEGTSTIELTYGQIL